MRGKFKSLTLINWNGFFARTFDLDQLVTTLSGGNGAGKSTTMAAFITALIPDQTLLHFRNTTEAGSSSASRDKGLYGKLQRGHCYSMLEAINSREQRIWVGVHLEQVANRDNKVNITPFALLDVPQGIQPTDLLLERLEAGKGRVRPFNDLKVAAQGLAEMKLVKFNSVSDYHNFMFEHGITPKKLRDQKDRGKFYRLIEASLYGGISSSISRSLREYLLPENSGVRKAFHDMEAAIFENRRTLEAIRETQGQRDLFKSLITETTHYVAAEYVRGSSERERLFNQALKLRQELSSKRRLLAEERERILYLVDEVNRLHEEEKFLGGELEAATAHLAQILSAVALAQKIETYQESLTELSERLEEQEAIVEEIAGQLLEAEEGKERWSEEVDSLKSQLADYQQALDVQQTRAIQYRQAVNALEEAQLLLETPDLRPEAAAARLGSEKELEKNLTSAWLGIKQQRDLAQAAASQYASALALVQKIEPEIGDDPYATAQQLLKRQIEAKGLAARADTLREQLKQLQAAQGEQQKLQQLSNQLESEGGLRVSDGEMLQQLLVELEEQRELQTQRQSEVASQRAKIEQQQSAGKSRIEILQQSAPAWLRANEALLQLRELSGLALEDGSAVSQGMQQTLEEERNLERESTRLKARKAELDSEIQNLQRGSSSADPRLAMIAEQIGGVPIADVYDDIGIDDAPYYSAVYGPARHGLVVLDLDGAIERLAAIEDCPEDLYLIQGNPDSFDEDLLSAEEREGAVLVRGSARQARYSRFPTTPLFGRAAREARIALLNQERDVVIEEYANVAFEQQRFHRLYGHFSDFIGQHLQLAFSADPEVEITALHGEGRQLHNELQQLERVLNESKGQLQKITKQWQLAQALLPLAHHFASGDQAARLATVQQELSDLAAAEAFLSRFSRELAELEQQAPLLRQDPEQFEALQEEYLRIEEELAAQKRRCYLLEQLVTRLPHFAYADASAILGQASSMSDSLKAKLALAEVEAKNAAAQQKAHQAQHTEALQILSALRSSVAAKSDTLGEFSRELQALNVVLTPESEAEARSRKGELEQQLANGRANRSATESKIAVTKRDIDTLDRNLKQEGKGYREARSSLIRHKATWARVVRLARDTDVERRLNRRELAYLSAEELRSMSDKALGTLRVAVANDEALRDGLRRSEGAGNTEQKVAFYIQVYCHLKDRIRHDIIRTDDPVEAIEEMEIELARLADELSQRESHLSLSSKEVAAKITNIIRREQNRIRLLNQGLQNIAFGLVRGVRLNVKVREAHTKLLEALSNQSALHGDLFANQELTFSEAIARLYQRLNPQIDQSDRNYQVMGEMLLDYRNYLELEIEVLRGADGWLRAESGALSTGEAIGTGQAILLMVLISWEEESQRLRGKDLAPCRLLFLDEAARLDAKSIATLFELCERQDMQLLIAAPENISPDKGTTYKLIRKVQGKQEHVHVVGLRGFGFSSETQTVALM